MVRTQVGYGRVLPVAPAMNMWVLVDMVVLLQPRMGGVFYKIWIHKQMWERDKDSVGRQPNILRDGRG